MSSWRRHPGQVLFVVGFFVCLWLPLADLLLGLERAPRIVENRTPAPPPKIEPTWQAFAEFPRAFEAYWNDRFGFRRTLNRAYFLTSLLLGVSPSEKVIFGKSRWLFFDDELAWRKPGGRVAPTDDQLEGWRRELATRRDWLKARGARYLFVIVPDKATVYPEYLPDALRPPATPSDADQFMRALEVHPDIDVLDLRPVILAAKSRQLVYHPADSHWNDAGIYAGYAAIAVHLERWFPGLAPLPLSAFDPVLVAKGAHDDLAQMVGLREHFAQDATFLHLREQRARPASTSVAGSPGRTPPFATETPDSTAPRVLVLIDSFGLGLAPFLAEHSGRAVFVDRREFDPAAVVLERPNVVIQEVVERLLRLSLLPVGLPPAPEAPGVAGR